MRIAKVFLLTFVALAVLAIVGVSFASAQIGRIPYVGVFSEIAAWQPSGPGCPIGDGLSEAFIPPGVAGTVDSLYVVAYNFDCLVTAIEFQLILPPAMTWIADICAQPVTFGSSIEGFAMGWPTPQDGFQAINIVTVIFQWNITSCGGPRRNLEIQFTGHPLLGNPLEPQYTCFNEVPPRQALGLTSLICPTVPVEESTWGKVKAVYVE